MDRRQELIEREENSWRAFLREVGAVPADARTDGSVVPGWSVKDLVWHCGGWARFAADHLQTLGGGAFTDPFDGVPDEHWDRASQDMIDESHRMTFEEVIDGAEDARAHARSVWQALPQVGDEAARFFAEETSEHYDEHRAEIRAFRERG